MSSLTKPLPKFHRQKEEIDEIIQADYDSEHDWQEDPAGYFLIRVNAQEKRIEVAFVTNDHVIRKIFYGQYATEIYQTIMKHNLLTRFEHAAYLGKELCKAEMAFRYGKEYRQSFPLDFPELPEVITLERKS